MAERKIGVRELKANLSACLREVKSGDSIVITERGRPVGRLLSIDRSLDEKLKDGTRSRLWSWNGRKWKPSRHRVKGRGNTAISDLLLEDRA